MFDLQKGILTNLKKWVEIYAGAHVLIKLKDLVKPIFLVIRTPLKVVDND